MLELCFDHSPSEKIYLPSYQSEQHYVSHLIGYLYTTALPDRGGILMGLLLKQQKEIQDSLSPLCFSWINPFARATMRSVDLL